MAEKAKKTTKTKKTATKSVKKPATTTIKSSVTGKKKTWDKPAIGKIVCLCVAVIALLVIIVAIVLGTQPSNNNLFVSDGTKYVLNMPADEDNEDNLVTTHLMYYYKDDDITGAKIYYEFKTADDAKKAYDTLMTMLEEEEEEDKSTYELSGKYLIVIADEEEYSELKASDIKSYIELYEASLNGDTEETTDDTENSEE